MEIRLMPQRRDDALTLERRGDRLVINDVEIDFADLKEGETRPRADLGVPWLAEDVRRQNGVLQITLYLPVGPEPGEAERFPARIRACADGPVPLPGRPPAAEEFNPDL